MKITNLYSTIKDLAPFPNVSTHRDHEQYKDLVVYCLEYLLDAHSY